ncbi:hypothetical protein AD428_02175 [Achromobacter sp. DMS1]|nr:hypothetical protein AD428_02175 [Achromobacter sp. DMS1]
MPSPFSVCSVWSNACWPGRAASVSCAWCRVARFSQSVVEIEVPNAPAVRRRKFDSPEAAGMRQGSMPESVMEVSGTKNAAMAAPWMMVGTISVRTSVWVLKPERMKQTSAKIMKATVTSWRGSRVASILPTMGVSRMARKPTGAVTRPA